MRTPFTLSLPELQWIVDTAGPFTRWLPEGTAWAATTIPSPLWEARALGPEFRIRLTATLLYARAHPNEEVTYSFALEELLYLDALIVGMYGDKAEWMKLGESDLAQLQARVWAAITTAFVDAGVLEPRYLPSPSADILDAVDRLLRGNNMEGER